MSPRNNVKCPILPKSCIAYAITMSYCLCLKNGWGSRQYIIFSDVIFNALKILLLILLFVVVFNNLYHSEKVSLIPILQSNF